MRTPKIYLYAVIPSAADGSYSPHGVSGLPVHLYSQGAISAAFSFIASDVVPRDEPAHKQVLQLLLRHSAVLPAPVPTILTGPEALRKLLTQKQQRMVGELQQFHGHIEVRLSVSARAPHSARAGAADEKNYLLARLTTVLRSGGFCTRQLPPGRWQELFRLGCLFPADFLEQLLTTCASFQKTLGAHELRISQPMAPIDFVSRSLFGPELPSSSAASAAAA